MNSGGFLSAFIKKRPLLTFFLLTYFLNSIALGPQVLYAFGRLRISEPLWYAIGAVCSPTVAALVVQWFAEHDLRMCRTHDSWTVLAVGVILGPALVLVAGVVVPAVVVTKAALQTLHWDALSSFASYHCHYSAGYYGLLLAPLIEEPGWRGYALPRLQARMGPAWAAVVLGILWAGWHFPSFLLGASTPPEILRSFCAIIALSILMSLGANLFRFTIVVAISMHAAANARGCLIENLATGMQQRIPGAWIWTISALLVPAAIMLVTRGRLGAARELSGNSG